MTISQRPIHPAYLAMADYEPKIRTMDDPSTAALRAFRRFHPDARMDYVGRNGDRRWMTAKQMRIHAVIARLSVSQGHLTMSSIALECGVTAGTVSRFILKLQAWGWFAVDVVRGRNGGIRVWPAVGERFRLYAVAARQKIAQLRRRLNVASVPLTKDMSVDATFSGRTLYARAYLALDDPEGEHDPLVLHPILGAEDVERAMILAQDVRRRHLAKMIDSAERGDWAEWERLQAETPA